MKVSLSFITRCDSISCSLGHFSLLGGISGIGKGYLKIHIAVDIKKKRILSLEVTSEEVHDGKMLKKLVDNASENNNLKGILADGMYDSNNNFRYLSKNHIKPGIKTRSNSKVKSTNCHARNMSVVRQQTNLKRWRRSVSMGTGG